LIFEVVINVKDEVAMRSFGIRLRDLRRSRGLSQEMLGNIAGISMQQVGRIERGELNLTLSTMTVLAKAMDISVALFFN
jgi:transcriptional regulator with XRE-family HTH domain